MKMSLRLAVAGCIFLSSVIASAAHAEASGKVLIVDMQRVITESIMGKAAQSDLQGEAKKREVKLQQKSNQIKELGEQIEKQSSLLSKDALDQKKQEVGKKQKELERAVADDRQEMGKMRDESLVKVVKAARKAVQDIAASRGVSVVMEKDPQVILYANEDLDITSDVVKLLDSKKLGE